MGTKARKKPGTKSRKRRLLWLLSILILVFLVLLYNPISVRLMTVGVAVWHGLDPVYFYKLIRTESSFRSFAVSPRNAMGLGQIRESTAFYIRENHRRGLLFVPIYNLNLSARYIKYLRARYDGNWSLTLAAYNWGETNVSRRIREIQIDSDADYRHIFRDIPETYNYITKIMGPAKKA
ncbi:MAG: lytic transglycosylase domain-containing protein [Candidatus Cloacimonetes bacterium]|nr:lytic transglycosylase domain-containing protein [Candidatus Cloacimonadota bacterium]